VIYMSNAENAYTDPKFTAHMVAVYKRAIKRGDNSARIHTELAAAQAALNAMKQAA
jgi:hypothetical protein